MNLDEDYEIDDILKPKRKKGVNPIKKGHRGENGICKILFKRFNKSFSRSIGSGNRFGQIKNMPKHAIETFAGDICPPENFLWTIEVKNGYDDIDFNRIISNGNKQLDEFMLQTEEAAGKNSKKPMLLFKQSRKPWLCFVKTKELNKNFTYCLTYKDWSAISLEEILKVEDSYYFTAAVL